MPPQLLLLSIWCPSQDKRTPGCSSEQILMSTILSEAEGREKAVAADEAIPILAPGLRSTLPVFFTRALEHLSLERLTVDRP